MESYEHPFVSAIIPVFNDEEGLKLCLENRFSKYFSYITKRSIYSKKRGFQHLIDPITHNCLTTSR